MKRKNIFILGIALLMVLIPRAVWASEGASPESNAIAIDAVWTLLAAFLVMFMQPGFALVEAGFIRAKNAANIIMKNVMDFAAGSIVYFLIGFAIMFGIDKAGIIGLSGFGMSGTFEHLGLSFPIWVFLMFQTVFAATAATIVSGAVAERIKFGSYLIFSVLITAVIYPVVGHWIWGGGWLASLGMIDFAGSTVVHSVGGWAALVGAFLLGPRLGKYSKDGKAAAIPGHNITLAALGVFILWFGWFGFNCGSTVSGTSPDIGLIAVNTNIAAAAGAVGAMLYSWIKYRKPDVTFTLNGALAGLVGITAGCASVNPMGAIIIGLLAGVLVTVSVQFLDNKLRIDDPVGAISVHGVCGAFGTAMVGLLAVDGGLFYGGGASLLLTQIIGIAAVFVWVIVASFIVFGAIKAVMGLRVSEEEELGGLDINEHGMNAYADFMIKS